MPRRDDYHEAYWVFPVTLQGYPDATNPDYGKEPARPRGRPEPTSQVIRKRTKGSRVRRVDVKHLVDRAELIDPKLMPTTVVLVTRDRLGFKYERVVALEDYVSRENAAKLLGVPLMTIHRWVDNRTLPSRKRKGVPIVKIQDLLTLAINKKRKIRMGVHFVGIS